MCSEAQMCKPGSLCCTDGRFIKIPLHLTFIYNLQQGPLCLLRVTSNDCKCPTPVRGEEQILLLAGTSPVLLLIGGLT